jgi:glutamate N-acetyltransferase/amino-acid N-acetyltransferase
MTTDTVHKETAYEIELDGHKAVIGGMAKGSGMIHPNMCTMLSYVTTDAAIEKSLLQKALREIVAETFNMISVDGDTSTNDTLLVLANGLAGNPVIDDPKSDAYAAFYEALRAVCKELAMKMAGDGEGATKLIETRVIHADTLENARILAKSVITSSLTKAAVYGRDANWGRVLCALGYSGVSFDPENCDLYFGGEEDRLLIFTKGSAADYSEEKATELLSGEKVEILADMHMGDAEATAWGCDLTYDYVKINADYRS